MRLVFLESSDCTTPQLWFMHRRRFSASGKYTETAVCSPYPEIPAIVFKQGTDKVTRKSVIGAVDVDLVVTQSIEPAFSTYPYIPFTAFQDTSHIVARQSHPGREGLPSSVFVTAQSTTIGSNPHCTLAILIECSNSVACQSVRVQAIKDCEPHAVKAHKPGVRSEPYETVSRLNQTCDRVLW